MKGLREMLYVLKLWEKCLNFVRIYLCSRLRIYCAMIKIGKKQEEYEEESTKKEGNLDVSLEKEKIKWR